MSEPRSAHDAPAALPPLPGAIGGTSGLRRNLLMRLRHEGPSAPEELATALGASRTGALQQLHGLEAAVLVSRPSVRHGVGRPRHVYDVTEAAQDLFPTNYDGLAVGLLAAIRSIGGRGVARDVLHVAR